MVDIHGYIWLSEYLYQMFVCLTYASDYQYVYIYIYISMQCARHPEMAQVLAVGRPVAQKDRMTHQYSETSRVALEQLSSCEVEVPVGRPVV